MITGHVFIACSLDGFIARSNDGLDWLMKQDVAPDEGGFADFMAGIDGLVMGRGTFDVVRAFEPWPYDKPVVVLSRTMQDADLPEALSDKVRVSNRPPADLMAELETEGWSRVYVDGGRTVQSFLRAGLVADITVTVAPILIGEGKRLFGTLPEDVDLQLREATRIGRSDMVRLAYAVKSSS